MKPHFSKKNDSMLKSYLCIIHCWNIIQKTLPTHCCLYESHCVCGQQPEGELKKERKKTRKVVLNYVHNEL